jgi:hypothetical protein
VTPGTIDRNAAPWELCAPATSRATRLTGPSRWGWLTFLCLNLLGYALLGRGWAHMGISPVFVGELVLFCGVVSFLLLGRWRGILDIPVVWFLLLLQAWGAYRTLPYLSTHGAEALRDAVIWGYSAFAFIVLGAIQAQPRMLAVLLTWYKKFALIFLICIPFVWFTARVYPRPVIPHLPWADVAVIHPKAGDILVHAAGILAFWVAGFGGVISLVWVLLLTFSVVMVGTFDRAGLVSFLTAFAVCFFLRPRDRCLWRLAATAVCGLLLFAVSNVRVQMPQREREVSFDQVIANVTSTVSSSRAGDLDGTKEWRLEWWRDILKYTLHGKYWWDGKGFGINLADDDGYQVEEDSSLRHPHNGHLTMLARAGVPGFLLWGLVQLSWAGSLFGGYLRSQKAGDRRWASVFLFLLAYWLAFMINATFDVFLEGPMGGIWFWTVYGVGLAAVWLYKHHPAVLDGLPFEPAQGVPLGDRS